MATKKIIEIAKKEFDPFLNSYIELLLEGLEKEGIIKEVNNPDNNGDKMYQLSKYVKEKVSAKEFSQKGNELFNGFSEFREIIINVYHNLKYEPSHDIRNVPLSTLIEKFESLGVFRILNPESPRLKEVINSGERLFEEATIKKDAIELFSKNKLNFNSYINSLLEFYLFEKVKDYFKEFKIEKQFEIGNRKVDFLGQNENENSPNLIFEFSYRKKALSSIKENLFKGYELLTQYNKINNKENFLILATFTDEDVHNHSKLHYRFKQNLDELFPNFRNKILFIPVSTGYLHLITDEFSRIKSKIFETNYESFRFYDAPRSISFKEEEKINASFLKSETGSFSLWVKLSPVQEYFKRFMNFEYLIAHATNNYQPTNHEYHNVFSISLAPNHTNNTDTTGKSPTELKWRFWISNAGRKNFYLNSETLQNTQYEWYHLLVRWDHKKNVVEFLINGVVTAKSNEYKSFWPQEFLPDAFLGTWGNKVKIHYINQPLYRIITSKKFLDDDWVKEELANKLRNN